MLFLFNPERILSKEIRKICLIKFYKKNPKIFQKFRKVFKNKKIKKL